MTARASVLAGAGVRSALRQAAVGVVCTALATVLRLSLAPLLAEASPYLVYTLSVAVATWLSGGIAGATAFALAVILGTFLFVLPYFSWAIAQPHAFATLAVFVLVASGLMWVLVRSRGAEAALRGSEERLSLALAAGRQAPWEIDLVTGEVRDSVALREIFGVMPGDGLRTRADWRRYVLPEDQPLVERAVRRAVHAGGDYSVEFRVRRATDGEVRWVASLGHAQRDEEGRPRRLVGFATDVTVRKWAEEALRESERRLRRIVEHIHDGLIIDDREGRVVFANDRFLSMFGFDRSRLETLRLEDYVAPDHRDRLLDRHRRRVAGEPVPEHFEYEGVRADGARLWVEVDVVPVVDDRGEIVGTQSAMRDVTERRRAEQALADSEERLRIALGAAKGGGYVFDLRTMQLSVSPEAAKVYGLPPGTLTKADALHVLPEDRPRLEQALHRALTGDGDYQVDYRVRLQDGSVRSLAAFGRVQAENQRLVGCVIDVTERARLAEELRRKAAELEEAGRLRDEFIATVSHELRTPLNAMLGWAELLRDRRLESPAAQDRAYAAIANNARRQAQLIEDLLDMSRIVAGKVRLEPRLVDPATVVQAAVEAVLPSAEAKAIGMEVAVPSGFMVLADPARLQQIAWNLLSNAVKFTPRGGRVRVSLGRHDREVELSVRDNGVGIKPEFLPYVFDRFRQADGDTTRAHGGLGLGLSIVRHLAEAQGGRVYAASAGEGQGATFAVLLPHADVAERRGAGRLPVPPPHRPAALPPPPPPPSLSGLQVLVVDDDGDARELTAAVLTRYGASVVTADGAAKALQRLESEQPDVLVLDIAMPGTDGYGLLRMIRERNGPGGRIPAVALTAYAREDDRRRAIAAGFCSHLSKPVEAADLARAVAEARAGARTGSWRPASGQ